MVAADQARIDSLKPMAEKMAAEGGMKIALVRFKTRELVQEFGG